MSTSQADNIPAKLAVDQASKAKKLPPQITKTYREHKMEPNQPPLLNMASLSTQSSQVKKIVEAKPLMDEVGKE